MGWDFPKDLGLEMAGKRPRLLVDPLCHPRISQQFEKKNIQKSGYLFPIKFLIKDFYLIQI